MTTLFTSVDTKLAKQTIAALLAERGSAIQEAGLRHESVLELLDLCLQTHFTFNGQLYEQVKGTPMGSPISGLVAEAVMQRLELIALPLMNPKLWVRYVDDTFVIIKRTELEDAHRLLNCVFTGIRFTREEEQAGQLSFLDV